MALTLAQESWKSSELGGGAGGLAAEGGANSDQQRPQSHGGGGGVRERLFEKVVTPSDVGKLNRLVVPKHFAEKHLPLLGAAARAGTVLCFHDARGHAAWRFRYSYWGSSQSYVMTKGWSRYVRDKRLAAGDTVSFCRDGARLYIDCRRRAKRAQAASLLFGATAAAAAAAAATPNNNNKAQQPLESAGIIDITGEDARRGRRLRLFGVDLELRAEPLLLDLQL